MKQLLGEHRALLTAGMILFASCLATVGVVSSAIEKSTTEKKTEELAEEGRKLTRIIEDLNHATNACRNFFEAELNADVGFMHTITQTGEFCKNGLPLKNGWVVIGRKLSNGSHTQLYNSRKRKELQNTRVQADSEAIININKLYDQSLRNEASMLSEVFEGPVTGSLVMTTLAALPANEGFYVSLAFDPTDIAEEYLLDFNDLFSAFTLETPDGSWVFAGTWSSELKKALLEVNKHFEVTYGDHLLHHVHGRDASDWAKIVHLDSGWSLGGVVRTPTPTALLKTGLQSSIGLITVQVVIFASFCCWYVLKIRERTIRKLHQETQIIRKANAQKASVIESMAHEIRSPIIRLIGTLELAQISKSEKDEALSRSLASASTVLLLCDDLLDLGQLSAGEYQNVLTSFDAANMLDEIRNEFSQYANEQKTQLLVLFHGTDSIITSDRLRVRQIISNLLHNALRASPGGVVSVLASASAKEPISSSKPYFKITVSDTGIGMTPDVTETIFDEFVTYSKNGTGLGLSVVKRIVQRLGGEIDVESSPGVGSVFTVTLPLHRQQQAVDINSSQRPLLEKSVLLVEDEDIIRKVTNRKLLEAGARVSTASDGQEAVIMCRSRRFDFILMDLEMPNVSGVEATREIRDTGLNKDTLIFGLSSHLRKHRWASGVEAGMNELFTKPIEISVISTFLRKFEAPHDSILSNEKLSADAPILNMKIFSETCCLNENPCNMELLNGFIAQAHSFKKKIETVGGADLSRLTHSFKGVSMIFGASLLTETLFLLEEEISGGNLNTSQEIAIKENIVKSIDATVAEMRRAAKVAM